MESVKTKSDLSIPLTEETLFADKANVIVPNRRVINDFRKNTGVFLLDGNCEIVKN